MPTKKLTDRAIANLKPPAAGRLELWDSILPGFGLRVTANDARSYFVMYRVTTPEGRVQRRLKIGNAKVLALAEAREAARKALAKVELGIDPAAERAVAEPPAEGTAANGGTLPLPPGLANSGPPKPPDAYQMLAMLDPRDMSPEEQTAVWQLIQYLMRKDTG